MRKLVFALSVACALPTLASVRPAKIFSDGMVLQQGVSVPVWGFADPGEKVTVSFAGQEVAATADASGRWQVRLAPLTASFEGRKLTISAQADNRAVLSDVLVGEVWILSGQSNMQYGLGGTDGWADAREKSARGELSALRFFRPDQESRSSAPLADLKAGAWHATTETEAFGRLSAAGFHFAEALLPALKVPVGLVNIPRGGTQMFQWVDAATFASDKRFAVCLKAKGKKKAPCEDWNGKAAPLAGLAVRGVVWYQGESDSWNPYPSSNFAPMLEKMIGCWRKAWGNPGLPFVIAQLPSMDARFWARTREAQDAVARKLKGVFLANLIDTGWCHDVHPHDKPWVGPRLANAALRGVYGRADVAVAPRLKDVSFAAGRATVAFDAPVTAKEAYRRGFELKAGGAWRPAASASVRADGTVEVVAADAAVRPEGVRYLYEGWAKPDVWLYGTDGTPAFAFTTVPADLDQALEASPATLFFAGDSTLDEHGGDESKFASWGSSLRPSLKPGMRIVNYAKSGRSTKSFRDEGWWDRVLSEVRPGDFVLIQFGHNDQKLDKPKVAVPQAQFKTNLWQMVREVRARHATPFFATPIVRLTYADGHLVDKAHLDAWAQRMREVAHEANVCLIDMRKLTHDAAETSGEQEALTWNVPGDRTHPAPKGARLYGELFLKDVTSRKLELAHLFARP